MRDGELPSFDKILEGNISKTQCNLSGYIYSDETSKWRLIGEIFEAEDRIEIKIVKQTSSFEDSLSLITFNNIGVRQIESLSGTVENEEGRAIGRAKLIRCLNKVSEHEEDVYNNTKENIKTNHVYYVQVLCSSNYKAIEREVREKMSEFISGNLQLHIKNNQAANCTRMMIGEFNDISSAKIFRDKYDLPYGRGVIVECFEGSDGKEIISTITE
ncbi:MAG TPA: hypothetical protein PLZ12_14415 [Saprospiraceae bacterium]|nr:hypothetical protein [Saprospiraceae bacterium]